MGSWTGASQQGRYPRENFRFAPSPRRPCLAYLPLTPSSLLVAQAGVRGKASSTAAAQAPPPDPSRDVFGLVPPSNGSEMIECEICGRRVVASRFTGHLEKCFGKGRAAGRVAAKRLQDFSFR